MVHLASDSFHYRLNDRCKIKMRRFATEQWPDTIGKKISNDLPLKVNVTENVLIYVAISRHCRFKSVVFAKVYPSGYGKIVTCLPRLRTYNHSKVTLSCQVVRVSAMF